MENIKKYIYNSKYQEVNNNYCIVEIGTSGLSYVNDEIIQIGIMKIKDGKQIDRFESLVKPENSINDNMSKITKITNDMLASAPNFKEIIPKIVEFIEDDVVYFHNARLDFSIFSKSFQKYGYNFNNTYIDLIKLLKIEYESFSDYKLLTIAEKLGIAYSKNFGYGMLERLLLLKHIINTIIYKFIYNNYLTIGENRFEKFGLLFYAKKANLLNNYKYIRWKYPKLVTEMIKTYSVNKRPKYFKVERRNKDYFVHDIEIIKENYKKQLPFKLDNNDDKLYKTSIKYNKPIELAYNNTMYEKDLCKEIWFASYDGIAKYPFDIIDIQVPLKPARKYKYGEIDIVGVDIDNEGSVIIYLIEVKPLSTQETLLRAVVESITYRYMIEDNIDVFVNYFKNYILKYNGIGQGVNKIKQMIKNNQEFDIKTKSMILVPEKLYKDVYSNDIYNKYNNDIEFYTIAYDRDDLEYHTKDNIEKATLFKKDKYPKIEKYIVNI